MDEHDFLAHGVGCVATASYAALKGIYVPADLTSLALATYAIRQSPEFRPNRRFCCFISFLMFDSCFFLHVSRTHPFVGCHFVKFRAFAAVTYKQSALA